MYSINMRPQLTTRFIHTIEAFVKQEEREAEFTSIRLLKIIHCGKPIIANDTNGRKTLSEYIPRAPFSLERMSFNESSDTVLYRGEHFHPTLAGNFDVAGPLGLRE
ncbi:MAG: hypothetical protein K8S62_02305 [Candidatus Sabulitectum sp.]|nr:hypothetical protein [Candidatus Sabulitectum sp.]